MTWKQWRTRILDALAPMNCTCLICRSEREVGPEGLCTSCEKGLSQNGVLHRRPAAWVDVAAAPFYYEEPVTQLITDFKYEGVTACAHALARGMAKTLPLLEMGEDALLVEVPLHRRRLAARGFNQSEILAHLVAEQLGIPFEKGVLARTRHTKQQQGLSAAERLANTKGAFSVKKPALVGRRPVILVDDVFTTGATMSACAMALKKEGALSVAALTAAAVSAAKKA